MLLMVRPVALRAARREEEHPPRTGVATMLVLQVQPSQLAPLMASLGAAPVLPLVAPLLKTVPLAVGGMPPASVGAAPLLPLVVPPLKTVSLAVVGMLRLLAVRSTLLSMAGKGHQKARRHRPRWTRPRTSQRPWRWSYAR